MPLISHTEQKLTISFCPLRTIQGHSGPAPVVIPHTFPSNTLLSHGAELPHTQQGSLPTISVARMVVRIVPFHSALIVPALHSGAPCDTCRQVQVNGRQWMPAASKPPRVRFRCGDFFPPSFFFPEEATAGISSLSIVSMPGVLLHIASPELNGTVLCGLSPKARFVKCTASPGMDTQATLLHR